MMRYLNTAVSEKRDILGSMHDEIDNIWKDILFCDL